MTTKAMLTKKADRLEHLYAIIREINPAESRRLLRLCLRYRLAARKAKEVSACAS